VKATAVIEEIRGVEKIVCFECYEEMFIVTITKHIYPHEHKHVILRCPKCGRLIRVETMKEERKGEDDIPIPRRKD